MAPEWNFLDHEDDDDDDVPNLGLEHETEPVRASVPTSAPSRSLETSRGGGVYSVPPPPASSVPPTRATMFSDRLPKVRFEKADGKELCTIGGCTTQANMTAVGLNKEIRHCDNGRHNVAANKEFFEQVDREGKRADLLMPFRHWGSAL